MSTLGRILSPLDLEVLVDCVLFMFCLHILLCVSFPLRMVCVVSLTKILSVGITWFASGPQQALLHFHLHHHHQQQVLYMDYLDLWWLQLLLHRDLLDLPSRAGAIASTNKA